MKLKFKSRKLEMEYFKKSKKVIIFTDKFLTELRNIHAKNSDAIPLVISSLGLFVKIVRTNKAIYKLCRANLNYEAHSLLRVLTEALITLQNIHLDSPEKNALAYMSYQAILDEKIANIWKTNSGLENASNELEELIKTTSSELKKEYGDESYEQMRRGNLWKGFVSGRIETAFNRVGMKIGYDTLYRVASRYIHADDYENYINLEPDESFRLLSSDDKDIDFVMCMGSLFVLAALEIVINIFNIGTGKQRAKRDKLFLEIKNYSDEIAKIRTLNIETQQ